MAFSGLLVDGGLEQLLGSGEGEALLEGKTWLGGQVLIWNEKEVFVKVVDAVTGEEAFGTGETVRFIVVPLSRVVFRVIECLPFSLTGSMEVCESMGIMLRSPRERHCRDGDGYWPMKHQSCSEHM